ncbi:MAG: DUF2630 family protein [Candidatus Baltobacteraceae bacterium]
MRDVFAGIAAWMEAGKTFALATLVATHDALPAPIGTTIAANEDGDILGNIGAGCYEGDIVEACLQTAQDHRTRVLNIDLAGADEVSSGNGCGGMLEVAVWRPSPEFLERARAIARGNETVQLAIPYERTGGQRVSFAYEIPARASLILVGATTLAAELAALARRLDFRTSVVDPRPVFATRERLSQVDEIVSEWPQDCLPEMLSSRTPIVLLSHDPKFDLPALRCALQSAAPYIGLLGSRRAQEFYRTSLRDDGIDESAIARIRGPAGLDLGGTSAAQTALSILSEIIAARHDRGGMSLHDIGGPIHGLNLSPLQRVVRDMPDQDSSVHNHIEALVKEEEALYSKAGSGGLSDAERGRLREIEVQLDRFYDLLHQRQGLRDAGSDPADAKLRPARQVENYTE